MFFWKQKKHWDEEYDEYYEQDRGIQDGKPREKYRHLGHLLLLILIAGLFCTGAGLISGKAMVEKLIAAVLSPVGIVWLILILVTYFSLLNRRGWSAFSAITCLLIVTIGGNGYIANQLALSLEQPFLEINPYDQAPYDVVVVLGGGTNTTLAGRSQLATNGDRIAVAARMFHGGKTKKIICTGSQQFRSTDKDLHPREEATNILVGMGVPREALLQMQGNNTSEEMINLAQWLEENEIQRVGLITSAWHLPRAVRLAESNGFTPEPLPANFVSKPFVPSPNLLVPNAHNLMISGSVCKEYLAGLAGR